ncbi:hypothetical protein MTO96_051125 [Rhipicephalus appendiculatus]
MYAEYVKRENEDESKENNKKRRLCETTTGCADCEQHEQPLKSHAKGADHEAEDIDNLKENDNEALHFSDTCHLLNNALEDGITTSSFKVVHDFVAHSPALSKSRRELRRKFGLVCAPVRMTFESLKTMFV